MSDDATEMALAATTVALRLAITNLGQIRNDELTAEQAQRKATATLRAIEAIMVAARDVAEGG